MPTVLINLAMSSNIQQLDAVCANTWQIMAVCGYVAGWLRYLGIGYVFYWSCWW